MTEAEYLTKMASLRRELSVLAGIASTLSKRRDVESRYYGAYKKGVSAGVERSSLKAKYRR